MRYQDAEIDSRILRAVEEMGFEQMTPIQEQAIPVLLKRRDVIGQAQTGTGKTAAFGIPVIQNTDPADRALQAVILCPTRELAIQAAEEMHRFAKYMHGIRILPIYGGQDINRQIKALKGGVQIIVGTPGRVMDHMRRHTLKMDQVNMVVLDEADEMLNMGFREDIETILQGIPSEHQTALFSATMPQPILEITHTYQKDADHVKVMAQELTIPLVEQTFYRVVSQTKAEVAGRLLDYHRIKRGLIFCNTKRMVDELSEKLKNRGYAAEGLHGDLSQNQRDTVMNRFRSGKLEILIATDVAARGIDVDDVEAVINYDLPQDIEYYVHRIGRTGRAGKEGKSFTFVSNREMYCLREIERTCRTTIEERRIPSVSDILTVKMENALGEAFDVLESSDVENLVQKVEENLQDKQWNAAQLAAAFLKLSMGEEPQEIPEVLPERKRNGYASARRGNGGGREDAGRRKNRGWRESFGRRGDDGRKDDSGRRPGYRRDEEFGRKPGYGRGEGAGQKGNASRKKEFDQRRNTGRGKNFDHNGFGRHEQDGQNGKQRRNRKIG